MAADLEKARIKLERVLAELLAADSPPWDTRRALHWPVVFPRMTNWLPEVEARAMRERFESERARAGAP